MGPSRHGMVPPKVVNGEGGLHICKTEMTILKRQSQTADKGGPPPLGLGKGLRTSIWSSSGKFIIKR